MPEVIDEPIREHFMQDYTRFIAELLEECWSLGPKDRPDEFMYSPSSLMMNARVGSVYVYRVSRTNDVSSMDYSTVDRTTRISIRISTPLRDTMLRWGDEVYRIIYANRRIGTKKMKNALFIKVINDNEAPDLLGWYTLTIDIQIIAYNSPIISAGFGNCINKEVNTNHGD